MTRKEEIEERESSIQSPRWKQGKWKGKIVLIFV
jgi:hypothetical protein